MLRVLFLFIRLAHVNSRVAPVKPSDCCFIIRSGVLALEYALCPLLKASSTRPDELAFRDCLVVLIREFDKLDD